MKLNQNKDYIQATITTDGGNLVSTPYYDYEFDNGSDAQEFYQYLKSLPSSEYGDPKTGPIIEHCYFINHGM